MGEDRPTPADEVRRLYEESESRTAQAMERLVGSDAFGVMLARVTENVMALTRIGFDAMDLTVRNLRLAGRQDVVRLGRQLARTEDKLELLLQEVEKLSDEVRGTAGGDGAAALFRSSGGQGGSRRRSSSSSSNGSDASSSSGRGSSSSRSGSRSGGTRKRSSSGSSRSSGGGSSASRS